MPKIGNKGKGVKSQTRKSDKNEDPDYLEELAKGRNLRTRPSESKQSPKKMPTKKMSVEVVAGTSQAKKTSTHSVACASQAKKRSAEAIASTSSSTKKISAEACTGQASGGKKKMIKVEKEEVKEAAIVEPSVKIQEDPTLAVVQQKEEENSTANEEATNVDEAQNNLPDSTNVQVEKDDKVEMMEVEEEDDSEDSTNPTLEKDGYEIVPFEKELEVVEQQPEKRRFDLNCLNTYERIDAVISRNQATAAHEAALEEEIRQLTAQRENLRRIDEARRIALAQQETGSDNLPPKNEADEDVEKVTDAKATQKIESSLMEGDDVKEGSSQNDDDIKEKSVGERVDEIQENVVNNDGKIQDKTPEASDGGLKDNAVKNNDDEIEESTDTSDDEIKENVNKNEDNIKESSDTSDGEITDNSNDEMKKELITVDAVKGDEPNKEGE